VQESKARPKAQGVTPSQTVGPYFAYGLTSNGRYDWNDAFSNNLVTPDTSGERVRVEGRVFDGDGQPVPDCMLEIWQADAQGRFSDPQDKRALPNSSFKGFGRCGTDANGGYAFDTIKPGTVPDPDGKPQAPHLLLAIFARGMLLQNYSRIYFGGEPANANDPVLALVPMDRRATLIAQQANCNGNAVYRLDIHLQGDNEMVFFDV
jgi:protocatechuate 3,4-dioxygenase, alpha subunit